jgi:predicted RNase H-like nuclease
MDVYIGFHSAWTDKPKAPGAICAIAIKDRQPLRFYAPQFVSFNQALPFIKSVSADDGITLIALDQPTVALNSTGMRLVMNPCLSATRTPNIVVTPASPAVRDCLTREARKR